MTWRGLVTLSLTAGLVLPSFGMDAKAPRHPVSGYHEAVLIVRDAEPWRAALSTVAGWEELRCGRADSGWTTFWGLDTETELRESLWRNPGTTRGWLRLVEIEGAQNAPMIRPHAQSWDTGGHFDLNLRAIDVDQRLTELEPFGFAAYSEPVEFTFGPFRVREVLARGPDGVVLAMIERLEPALEGWPHLERLSRLFNATQIVADFDRGMDFYTRILGFKTYLEHHGASKKPGPSVLGLPHNLNSTIPRQVAVVSPEGDNDGSIEILAFEGLSGADFSDRAAAPHRGIFALRFPVRGLDAWRVTLQTRGAEPGEIVELTMLPNGPVRVFALKTPEGARLEFFEAAP